VTASTSVSTDPAGLDAARVLRVPAGSFNFRDIGGSPTVDGRAVRRGLVFRSGALDGLTAPGWAQLVDLGVVTVVDLRAGHELRDGTDGTDRPGSLEVVRVPMWEDGAAGTTLLDRGVRGGLRSGVRRAPAGAQRGPDGRGRPVGVGGRLPHRTRWSAR